MERGEPQAGLAAGPRHATPRRDRRQRGRDRGSEQENNCTMAKPQPRLQLRIVDSLQTDDLTVKSSACPVQRGLARRASKVGRRKDGPRPAPTAPPGSAINKAAPNILRLINISGRFALSARGEAGPRSLRQACAPTARKAHMAQHALRDMRPGEGRWARQVVAIQKLYYWPAGQRSQRSIVAPAWCPAQRASCGTRGARPSPRYLPAAGPETWPPLLCKYCAG